MSPPQEKEGPYIIDLWKFEATKEEYDSSYTRKHINI